ncbi:MAG TPA: hypothetical protein PKL78_10365 [Anaerolineales bacterium]|nr:hypothetical protein [Anaerolineales bacterium]HNN13954.1 hypothetical protein [Anaerolineales bacterium]HNO31989.1 hypothetical protein [Anaerolineales bacterium]
MESKQTRSEDAAYKVAQNAISGQETIRWVGIPDPLHAIRKTWLVSAIGLIFGAFVYFIFSRMMAFDTRGPFTLQPSSNFKVFASLILIIFIIVIARFVFAPLWEFLVAKGKVYVITDQRALIIEQFPSDDQTSYYPKDIKFVQVKGKGIGDVIFDRQMKTVTEYENVPGSGRQRMVRRNVRVDVGFRDIPLPSPASELLLQMKASVQPPVEKQNPARPQDANQADRFRQ